MPNVFTAIADILAGLAIITPLVTQHGIPLVWLDPRAWLLVLASVSLYLAGMVWNDLLDLAVDRRERPTRPLPAGRVTLGVARGLGIILLIVGTAAAWAAGREPGIISLILVAAIFAYNGFLKKTPLGPLGMGTCRFLNLLLGLSYAGWPPHDALWLAPLANGLYIVGVTIQARDEAATSRPRTLAFGALVMLGGLLLQMFVAHVAPFFTFALILMGLQAGQLYSLLHQTMVDPSPVRVQELVKRGIIGLIIVDAIWTIAFASPLAGLLVALLVVPAMLIGQWLYST